MRTNAAVQVIPKTIKLAGGNETLTIQWSDGHASAYPYRLLREKCPCATCTESGLSKPAALIPLPMLGVKPIKPLRAELVGRYAVQIYWNDGHSTGIYAFDFLRDLCPCAECTAKKANQPAV
jgi:DUF971 family protein